MTKRSLALTASLLICFFGLKPAAVGNESAPAGTPDRAPQWYTFAWPLDASEATQPRGGTTTGVPVTPDAEPAAAWRALQEPDLGVRERDRRAILALAGEYRTGFDFLETLTFLPDLERARPYQSWATEHIFVLENEPDFISLQHIMVMTFIENGEIRGPFVQKHWRQDWRYASDRKLEFLGDALWKVHSVTPETGTWTQTVFQVDDTPRYAARGQWEHRGAFSVWTSERDWRPLPRRESGVRDDYQALASEHRVSITPGGWVHEQDNLKAVIEEPGVLHPDRPYLAREQGVARYTRIRDYDFSPGEEYWADTAPYWREVRGWWRNHLATEGGFRLERQVDGQPLFMPMFRYAERLRGRREDGTEFDRDAARSFIEDTLLRYVEAFE